MKIKSDFITNSSSTSFFFIFNGGKINLYEKLVKYKKYFNLTLGNMATINIWDVIRELDSIIRIHDDQLWINPTIQKIDVVVKNLQESLNILKADLEKKNLCSIVWVSERVAFCEQKLKVLEECKKRNLVSVLKIGFGDNDGEISGGNVGTTMDYEGRHINIEENDFVIFTEQNR